jgi:hypothetical protein
VSSKSKQNGHRRPKPRHRFTEVDEMWFDGNGTADHVRMLFSDNGSVNIEVYNYYDELKPSEVINMPAAQAFELVSKIHHTAQHAADAAGLCSDCGGVLDDEEVDAADAGIPLAILPDPEIDE